MESEKKVLVTGASGYLASHLIHLLLENGYYVVGTVRSLANKDKYSFLLKFPNAETHLELREANLLQPETWDKALEGIENVFHVASPIPPGVPKDQNDIIKPAVEGTQNIITASLKHKVKRLVFTSSCLTVIVRNDGKVTNEDDWSDPALLHHYPKSKYLAEKLFWEEAAKHKGELEFVSVLPSLVTGPAYTKHGNSSELFISDILNGGYPGIPTPSTQYGVVDVRDSANAHLKAFEYPGATGKRYIANGGSINTADMFKLLREKYEPQGYKIPSNQIDAEGIKKSGHGPSLRTLSYLGRVFKIDNSRGVNELGLTYRSVEQSIIDQAQAQIALGIVKKPE